MAIINTIGGSSRPFFMNSLKMSMVLGQPSTASFDLRGAIPRTLVTEGQEVIISDDTLTDTIRQSVPSPNPPGLRYESGFTGEVDATIIHVPRSDGTVEFLFANLYNLPDLRLPPYNVGSDTYIRGGYLNCSGTWFELGVFFKFSNGKFYYYAAFYPPVGSGKTIISTSSLILDITTRISVTWHTLTTTTALEMFINGASEATATMTGVMTRAAGTDVVSFSGAGAPEIGQYFADVRLWRDVRTPTEILTNAFIRLTGADLTDTNLDFYWKCDEMTGTAINDSGTYGNNGTMTDLEWKYAPDPWLPNSGPTCTDATVPFHYFGGRVSSVSYEYADEQAIIQHVNLIDYSEAALRRLVNQNFGSAHDGKYYMNYIGLHCLDPEGIAYGCIPAGSLTFSVPDWTNATAKKAMDDIYTATGWIWYIDPYKELRYHSIGYKAAPFNIADTDSPSYYLANSMQVQLDRNDYYNQILARIMIQVAGVQTTYLIRISNTAEIVARAAAEGTSGIYTHWEDITNASTLAQGISLAQGMLTNASTMGKVVTYRTRTGGLKVGQTQNIQNSDLGISGTFLIEQIDISQNYPDLYYSVRASSWKRYKNSSLQNTITSNINAVRNWTQNLADYTDVPYSPTY